MQTQLVTDQTPQRYLAPSGNGVLHCLGEASNTLVKQLFTYLLRQGKPTVLDTKALAEKLQVSHADFARSLFALNRAGGLTVIEPEQIMPASWAYTGLAELQTELMALAKHNQKIMLSSDDGFCLARTGSTQYEAETIAALIPRTPPQQLAECRPLYFGQNKYYISSNILMDERSPAMLRLAYRLQAFADLQLT